MSEQMSGDEVRAFIAAARGDVACDEDTVRQWLARGATHIEKLEQALATERKRREAVEDLWYAEQQAHTAAVTRAEQAERERDVAQAQADGLEVERDQHLVRAEQAEGQLRTTHAQVAEVARLLDPEVCPDAWGLHAAAQKVLTRAEQAERCAAELREERADLAEKVRQYEREWDTACDGWLRDAELRKRAEAERDALQRHYDAAGPEHNLLALLDLYDERTEEAKRERDEARVLLDEAVRTSLARQDEWRAEYAARERAEADNGALLGLIRNGAQWLAGNAPRDLIDGLADAAETSHPGAALLEEMKFLRADLAKLEESACGTCAPDEFSTLEARKVAVALNRMWALEEVHSVACEMNAGDTSTAAWASLHEALSAVDAMSKGTT